MNAWAEVISAGAGWTAILVTVLLYLHARRLKMLVAMEAKFDRLQGEMVNMAEANRHDHAAQARQIQDIALTVASNYVRHPQLEAATRDIHTEITEMRKELGTLHVRIDQLLLRGERP